MKVPQLFNAALAVNFFGMLSLPANADVFEWENTRRQLRADIEQEQIEVVFKFTNHSTDPVVVKSVEPSCGCTVALLSRNSYRSGESGTVRAIVDLHGKTGRIESTIRILTNASEIPDSLVLQIEIPEQAVIAPSLLAWSRGSAPILKTSLLRLAVGSKLNVLELRSDLSEMQATWEKVDDHTIKISVSPANTQNELKAVIEVVLKSPGEGARQVRAKLYARVWP